MPSPKYSPPTFRLGDLPPEIIVCIAERLPPETAACLALTCRSLQAILSGFLKDPTLQFPHRLDLNGEDWRIALHNRQLMPQYGPCVPPRQKLLRLLEHDNSDRYLYCSRCIKLHPIRDFSYVNRKWTLAKDRCCKLGRKTTVIDLCPGVSINFQSRRSLYSVPVHKRCYFNPVQSFFVQLSYGCIKQIDVGLLIHPVRKRKILISIRYSWPVSRRGLKAKPDMHTHVPLIVFCPHTSIYFSCIEGRVDAGEPWDRSTCRRCRTSWKAYQRESRYYVEVCLDLGKNRRRPSKKWLQHTSRTYYERLGRTI
ncbi:hypothetical protein BJX61DRAFT_338948 [Aspergillus egyptiacus]|nr:hypothetical protein BJX61DRAFT_338948 [Aspergillus egyptiacus]